MLRQDACLHVQFIDDAKVRAVSAGENGQPQFHIDTGGLAMLGTGDDIRRWLDRVARCVSEAEGALAQGALTVNTYRTVVEPVA